MFRKLLKYDMQSILKIWWIVAAVTIGASILGGIGFRLIMELSTESVDSLFPVILMLGGILFFVISVIALSSSFVITEVLIFWRFYKNFFTDEGYLTFTLPVSRKQLFLSKTVNAMVWSALHIVLVIIGFTIMVLIIPPTESGEFFINTLVINEISDYFSHLVESIGAWMIAYVIEALIIVFFSLLFLVSLIHMCITIGSVIAKKLKLLAAIGIFYAVNAVLSFVGQIFWMICASAIVEGAGIILSDASKSLNHLASVLLILILCAIMATLAFLVYCITQRLLERKLNLA